MTNATLKPLAYSTDEAAEVLGISKPTLYKYINREDFPAFKLGGRTLISVEGLQDWVRRQLNEQSLPPSLPNHSDNPAGAHTAKYGRPVADSDTHQTHVSLYQQGQIAQ